VEGEGERITREITRQALLGVPFDRFTRNIPTIPILTSNSFEAENIQRPYKEGAKVETLTFSHNHWGFACDAVENILGVNRTFNFCTWL